jgi:hypothetical protein
MEPEDANDEISRSNRRARRSRPPAGLQLMIDGILEEWKSRAFDAAEDAESVKPGAGPVASPAPEVVTVTQVQSDSKTPSDAPLGGGAAFERLRIYGFLQRTDPTFLGSEDWERLRRGVERSVEPIRSDARIRETLQATLERVESRVSAELEECIRTAFAAQWSRDESRAITRTARRQPDAQPDADNTMHTLRALQELDGLLLAHAALPDVLHGATAASDREIYSQAWRAVAIARQVARSGEAFESLDGWLAANERLIDPLFLSAAEASFRDGDRGQAGDSRDASSQILIASAGWLLVARARIRRARAAARDAARQSDPLDAVIARIEKLESGARTPADQWRLVCSDDDDGTQRPAHGRPPAAILLRWLAEGANPVRAAARDAEPVSGATMLGWQSVRGDAMARCTVLFESSAMTATDASNDDRLLVVRFFNAQGEPTRTFDGASANWLGVTTTIAQGRAVFADSAVRQGLSPSSVLQRSGALFVGGEPWLADFETSRPEGDDASGATDD